MCACDHSAVITGETDEGRKLLDRGIIISNATLRFMPKRDSAGKEIERIRDHGLLLLADAVKVRRHCVQLSMPAITSLLHVRKADICHSPYLVGYLPSMLLCPFGVLPYCHSWCVHCLLLQACPQLQSLVVYTAAETDVSPAGLQALAKGLAGHNALRHLAVGRHPSLAGAPGESCWGGQEEAAVDRARNARQSGGWERRRLRCAKPFMSILVAWRVQALAGAWAVPRCRPSPRCSAAIPC